MTIKVGDYVKSNNSDYKGVVQRIEECYADDCNKKKLLTIICR